ncbi:MAG: ATP-dependent DNA helicase UvrD2 [Acidimicrobiales bacterium]
MSVVPALADLIHDLNEAQRQAVTTETAPLCIVAGAGSGKTRVLTRRIAYRCLTGSADPRHVLALTFTRKAAGELADRLRHLGLRDRVTAGTFHAIAYAQLRTHWAERGIRPPTLLDRKVALVARLLPRTPKGGSPRLTAVDAANELEWAKARMLSPSRYAEAAPRAGRRPPVGFDEMAHLYERYEDEKRRRGLVDFDDLLWRCVHALATEPDVAAAQHWRFRHLFVDEFQDVNPLQHRLLEAWRGDRLDLCVVGDPNQAIYGWNGADPRLLTQFAERFTSAEVVVLEDNYRSTPQILVVANAALVPRYRSSATRVRSPRLRATRPDGDIPSVHVYPSERHEARAVARLVLDRHRPGVPWSHQAVLFRTNAQAVLFEEAFRPVGIPYRVRGRAPFLQLPELREVLKAVTRSRAQFRETLADIEASLPPLPDTSGGDGGPGLDALPTEPSLSDAELARTRNVQQLLRLADEYSAAEPSPTGAGFTAWLTATLRGEEADARRDAVELVTFHAAKGLEWPSVHVVGIEDGLVPIGHARTADELAEEGRLFYVAITRAEDELALSWAELRTFGTRTTGRSPSPYLDDIEPVLAAMRAGEEPADWREHLERERRRLRGAEGRPSRGGRPKTPAPSEVAPADRELFDALRRWRAEAARAANVPAYVVFHDTTLRAIAGARPASPTELLAVAGVGKVKASRFGDAVLLLVAANPR